MDGGLWTKGHCFSRQTQCNHNRSVCWCVNDNGEVLPGTKQPTNQDTRHHCGKCHYLSFSVTSVMNVISHHHQNSRWNLLLYLITSLFLRVVTFFLQSKSSERLLCVYLSWKSIVLVNLLQILIFDFAEKQLTKAVLMSFSIDEDIDMLKGKTVEFLQ